MSSPFLPDRSELSSDERRATAAVCILRAMKSLPPAASPRGQWLPFMVLHSTYYQQLLSLLVLFHLVLTLFEPPPSLHRHPDEYEGQGYWSRGRVLSADLVVCLLYNLHCLLVLRVERWHGVRWSVSGLLFVVVALLNVDMVVGAAGAGVRPFRCLRPFVFVFTSDHQTLMLQACGRTLASLSKTFLLLLFGIGFYAVIGLNLFHGRAAADHHPSRGNVFGAACLADNLHPFENYGYSFVSMYVLATTENFPEILWPFFSCACRFTPFADAAALGTHNTSHHWQTNDHCAVRHIFSIAFFGSFIILVFFCVGNSVLGVCYFWFEHIMKENVTTLAIRQRFSLIAAFYYLEEDGKVAPKQFLECVRFMRLVCPGVSGTVNGDMLFFRFLDRDGKGYLNLSQFFQVGELMRADVYVHRAKHRSQMYQRWKESKLRAALVGLIEARAWRLTIGDMVISAILLVHFVLATVETTRASTQPVFADVTVWVLVLEVVVKAAGYGVKTYWAFLWNRLDFIVTAASVTAAAIDRLDPEFEYVGVLQCLRLVRLAKVLSIVSDSLNAGELYEGPAPKYPKRRWQTGGFHSVVAEALGTALPVCLSMLLLLFFFVYFFAMIAMEAFRNVEGTTQLLPSASGRVDYLADSTTRLYWDDAATSLVSVFVINVGNDWHSVMYNTQQSEGNTMWLFPFFIFMHFGGHFLLLNIIQSLFVYVFSTFLKHDEFRTTGEHEIREQLVKLQSVSAASFKKISRNPKLEFLLLSWEDLDREYLLWLASQTAQAKPEWVDFGTARLRVSPLSPFFAYVPPPRGKQVKRTDSERFKSLRRNIGVEQFLREVVGARPDTAPAVTRKVSVLTGRKKRSSQEEAGGKPRKAGRDVGVRFAEQRAPMGRQSTEPSDQDVPLVVPGASSHHAQRWGTFRESGHHEGEADASQGAERNYSDMRLENGPSEGIFQMVRKELVRQESGFLTFRRGKSRGALRKGMEDQASSARSQGGNDRASNASSAKSNVGSREQAPDRRPSQVDSALGSVKEAHGEDRPGGSDGEPSLRAEEIASRGKGEGEGEGEAQGEVQGEVAMQSPPRLGANPLPPPPPPPPPACLPNLEGLHDDIWLEDEGLAQEEEGEGEGEGENESQPSAVRLQSMVSVIAPADSPGAPARGLFLPPALDNVSLQQFLSLRFADGRSDGDGDGDGDGDEEEGPAPRIAKSAGKDSHVRSTTWT